MSADNFDNLDDFLKLGDTSDIDQAILDEAGREDLIENLQKQKDKQTEESSPWIRELRSNWFSDLLLVLSFLLTETTALYLGLAPKLITENGKTFIQFNNDFGHIATAFVYMLLLPSVTEAAFWVFRNKFNKRETGNFAQQITSMSGAGVALAAIVGTGVAGTYLVFATLGSVGFLEIPSSVQNWLIWVMPSLIALYGLLYWAYEANSEEAKAAKLIDEENRKSELADRVRMSKIEQAGKRAIQVEAIRTYQRLVSKGLLSHQEARDALSSGISLVELEKKLRRDLTGDGRIGEATPPPSRPALPPLRPKGPKEYTLEEILETLNLSAEEAIEMIKRYDLLDAMKAYKFLAGYLPDDLREGNFMEAYCKLLGVAPTWGPVALSTNGASSQNF